MAIPDNIVSFSIKGDSFEDIVDKFMNDSRLRSLFGPSIKAIKSKEMKDMVVEDGVVFTEKQNKIWKRLCTGPKQFQDDERVWRTASVWTSVTPAPPQETIVASTASIPPKRNYHGQTP